jgi:cell wall-associated NlpC family hydrolase
MIVTRAQILAEAESWRKTPFRWQASVKGRGCDCRGFIFGVARELGLPEAKVGAVGVANYNKSFKAAQMLDGLERAMWRTEDPQPGDVIAMLLGAGEKAPRHLGILLEDGRMLHCYGKGPPVARCVISAPLNAHWPTHSFWTWPSLGEAASGH